ncbi:hypothetical protein BGI23_18000 [Bacillus sp. ABP14]|uniref:hypothetical protein n=1 Tax=Bacillus sp. ABP14 TaxID=1892404 RepID=UPI0008A8286F|nr:hypothetical protein [Bacillus sp. ABP14]AOY17061.1 hypothetical protein BGI23_18000 [Bacillus sp. ABP14]
MGNFKFRRGIRTNTSEEYNLYYEEQSIGELHIHFMKDNSEEICTLLITKEIEVEIKEKLIDEIIDTIISNPEGFFWINIYSAKFEGGIINESHPDGVTAKQKELSKVLNTFQVAKGQLSEIAAMQYFKGLNYSVELASDLYDKEYKIDVIGENEQEKLYIQVKLGKVSEQEIIKIVTKVAEINDTDKSKIACIVAERFPLKSELLRKKLEINFNIKIMYIHKYQVLESLPQYKRTLK